MAEADRRLLLLRHAKSSWDDPRLDDFERPLAPRGRRACELIAGHLRDREIEPDAVVCSPAVRAVETLERIRPALGGGATEWRERAIYGADWEELLGIAQTLPDELGTVLVIGHNPGVQDLTVALSAEGEGLERVRRKYPTAGLATLAVASRWAGLRPGGAVLKSFVRPGQLG